MIVVFVVDGQEVGRVSWDGDELTATPGVRSVVETWLESGRPASEFVGFYDGWSNGYVQARVAELD